MVELSVSRISCRHYVLCEVASKTKHFIILVLVSEFIVVAILSEWWSGSTTVGTSLCTLAYSILSAIRHQPHL